MSTAAAVVLFAPHHCRVLLPSAVMLSRGGAAATTGSRIIRSSRVVGHQGNNCTIIIPPKPKDGIIRRSYSSSDPILAAAAAAAANRISRRVSVRGVAFHVEQLRPDAPRQVLCLPGSLGTASTDFASQLDEVGVGGGMGLGEEFGLVAIDPRGLGGSTTTTTTTTTSSASNSSSPDSSHSAVSVSVSRDYPPDFYLRDALDGAAVMSALGYHGRYSVMGWSDGANSAIHLAAHRTTRTSVNKLVIWGGNSFVTQGDIEAYEAVRDVSSSWSDRMRDDKAAVHGGVVESLQLLNDRYTDAMGQILHKRGGDICLSELHKIACPTLVLHGSLDVICHEHHARYVARHISNARLEILPGGKHNLHMRHANEFHRIVREFLKDETTDDALGETNENEDGGGAQPDIDQIAYGFMGSKALFVALRAGVFDAIDSATNGSRPGSSHHHATFEEIEKSSDGIAGERLRTLLSACVALGLILRRTDDGRGVVVDGYRLPRASAEQLCRTSRGYWGDYLTMQVDGQFYDRLGDIDDVMRTGTEASHGYEAWFESDPDAARRYTAAQHNGSLATAYALHKKLPNLAREFPTMSMLDVGGGSGAFSIVTARRVPGARAVVLDLPNVVETAEGIIAEEDKTVRDRISTLKLSATDPGRWEDVVEAGSFDVVLMSYVSGSVPCGSLPSLYRNARRALRPGGVVVIHDFFIDNDGAGPRNAALWALAHVSVNPEGMGLVPRRVIDILDEEGFVAPMVHDLIPGMTQVIVARKGNDEG